MRIHFAFLVTLAQSSSRLSLNGVQCVSYYQLNVRLTNYTH